MFNFDPNDPDLTPEKILESLGMSIDQVFDQAIDELANLAEKFADIDGPNERILMAILGTIRPLLEVVHTNRGAAHPVVFMVAVQQLMGSLRGIMALVPLVESGEID